MSEDVVRLALDGKVKRKWKFAGERGSMSLLLDLDEVRAVVRGPNHGGFHRRGFHSACKNLQAD